MVIKKPIGDSFCNLCRREIKLSKEHVPPKSIQEIKHITVEKHFKYQDEKSGSIKQSQDGLYFVTLCKECNNNAGRHDKHYTDFCRKIRSEYKYLSINKIELLKNTHSFGYPKHIIHSVLLKSLAVKQQTDDVTSDKMIRDYLMGTSSYPDNIKIFYWVYPYDQQLVMKDAAFINLTFPTEGKAFFGTLIKSNPLAIFVVDTDENMDGYKIPRFEVFKDTSFDSKEKILVPYSLSIPVDWPESMSYSMVLTGREGGNAIVAKPKDGNSMYNK